MRNRLASAPTSRRIWRTYIVLLIGNQLDAVYTYYGLALGFFDEGNPLLQAHVYTWWPIAWKVTALAALALGIAIAVRTGWQHQRRLLSALRAVTAVYALVLVLHMVALIRTALGWTPPTGGIL